MSETGLLIHPLRGLNDVFMTKASIVRRWSVLLGFAFVCLLSRHTLGADKSPKQTGPTLESFLAKLGYTAIPLKRGQHNDLRVTAHLAGKEKEFLVDTGWSLTTLDTPLGRKFKTARERGVELKDTVLGVLDDSETVLIDELKLGAARFLDQPARVRPLSASGESAFADGVLGCDFLLRHFCLIDCAELRLYVRSEHLSREGKVAFEASLNQSGWHGAPLDRTSALVRTCKANIEGN